MLLGLVRTALLDRQRLLLENTALRQRVSVLERSVKRSHVQASDRSSWILMRRLLEDWPSCLFVVKLETAVIVGNTPRLTAAWGHAGPCGARTESQTRVPEPQRGDGDLTAVA